MDRRIAYCARCVMPETKPDLFIDDNGICSACRSYERRDEIDWDTRRRELLEIVERYSSESGSNYDCIVPVSGGKDSTYQVLRLLELGLNPLCVTATTDSLSDLGRRNIESLKRRGVDYLELTTNPVVRRRINRIALTQVGDISWPEHVTIFTIPVRVAIHLGIPLIVWGENPQHEYGGPASATRDKILTRRWLEEFGGLLGLRVSDLIGQEGIERRHLIQYTYPTEAELDRVGVTGLFLGYYLPWDGYNNALYAQAHGFETYPKPVEGSLVNYENLDNHQTGIHDYFKFLKYAFGRATDLASLHVRRGRLARADAVRLVREHDGLFPWVYLGRPIEELNEIEMTLDEFIGVCDRFTNKKLFLSDARGDLVKDRRGNLTKINYDNVLDTAELGDRPGRIGGPLVVQTVAIIDYGMGNLDSVARAIDECGARAFVTADPDDLSRASAVILPGVGAFAAGMANLRRRGLDEALGEQVVSRGVPLLGLCLGMQLLATRGTEVEVADGLGFVEGEVLRIEPQPGLRVPHVGWNEVHPTRPSVLLKGLEPARDFYFVHSYHLVCSRGEDAVGHTTYGGPLVAVIEHGSVYGVQFHPEKSQRAGFQLFRNFLELAGVGAEGSRGFAAFAG